MFDKINVWLLYKICTNWRRPLGCIFVHINKDFFWVRVTYMSMWGLWRTLRKCTGGDALGGKSPRGEMPWGMPRGEMPRGEMSVGDAQGKCPITRLATICIKQKTSNEIWFSLVYWGLTPQQQPGSYQGGEMMMMISVFWWRNNMYFIINNMLIYYTIYTSSIPYFTLLSRIMI